MCRGSCSEIKLALPIRWHARYLQYLLQRDCQLGAQCSYGGGRSVTSEGTSPRILAAVLSIAIASVAFTHFYARSFKLYGSGQQMLEVAARHNLAPHLRAREDAVLPLLTSEALPFANKRGRVFRRQVVTVRNQAVASLPPLRWKPITHDALYGFRNVCSRDALRNHDPL